MFELIMADCSVIKLATPAADLRLFVQVGFGSALGFFPLIPQVGSV